MGQFSSEVIPQKAGFFNLLDRVCDQGRCLVYVMAIDTVNTGDVVIIEMNGVAKSITSDYARCFLGHKVGVARSTFTNGECGFVVVNGIADVFLNEESRGFLFTTDIPGKLTTQINSHKQHRIHGIGVGEIIDNSSNQLVGAVLSEPYIG